MPSVKELAAAAEAGKLAAELEKLQTTIAIYFVADLIALNEEYKDNSKGFDKEVAKWQTQLGQISAEFFGPLLAGKAPTYKGDVVLFINTDRKLPDMSTAMAMNTEATARALNKTITAFSTATSIVKYAKSVVKDNPADPRVKGLRDAATFLSEPATL